LLKGEGSLSSGELMGKRGRKYPAARQKKRRRLHSSYVADVMGAR